MGRRSTKKPLTGWRISSLWTCSNSLSTAKQDIHSGLRYHMWAQIRHEFLHPRRFTIAFRGIDPC